MKEKRSKREVSSSSSSSGNSENDREIYKKSQHKSSAPGQSGSSKNNREHRDERKYHHHHYKHRRDERTDQKSEYNEYYEEKRRHDNAGHSKWDSPEYRARKHEHSHSRQHNFDRHDRRHHRYRNDNERGYERGYERSRKRRSHSNDHSNATWGRPDSDTTKPSKSNAQREKPNFGLSGKLTEETNTYKGVVIKYSEPPEARKPKRRWRLYPFKGEKALQTLYIHRESAYLIGRDRNVVDLPTDHPSCSKQHAVLQYRLVPFTRSDGSQGKRIRPYVIDLESANGTFLNNKKIEPRKYVELFEKDVLKFGFSSREYVLLHENSKDEAQDDDVKPEELDELPVKEEPNTEDLI